MEQVFQTSVVSPMKQGRNSNTPVAITARLPELVRMKAPCAAKVPHKDHVLFALEAILGVRIKHTFHPPGSTNKQPDIFASKGRPKKAL